MSKKILILEPSTTTQSIITTKLKKSEYEPVFETNGIKFLVSMYNTLPQLVLINAKSINPKSSELVRLIKSIDKLKKIPVIIMTDTQDISTINEIEQSSAVGYIKKPAITEDGLSFIEDKLRGR